MSELPPVESRDAAMLTCPYYQLGETCISGCWSEPSCHTDQPLNGWKWRDANGRVRKMPSPDTLRAIARVRMNEDLEEE